MNNYEFILTNEPPNKLFHMPTNTTPKAIVKAHMGYKNWEPARKVDMVPELKYNSLMIASKMADAKYIMVLMPEKVLIYDGNEVKLQVME